MVACLWVDMGSKPSRRARENSSRLARLPLTGRRTGNEQKAQQAGSGEVEEQHLGGLDALDRQLALVAHRGAVAGLELFAVEGDHAAHHLHPGVAALEGVDDALVRREERG